DLSVSKMGNDDHSLPESPDKINLERRALDNDEEGAVRDVLDSVMDRLEPNPNGSTPNFVAEERALLRITEKKIKVESLDENKGDGSTTNKSRDHVDTKKRPHMLVAEERALLRITEKKIKVEPLDENEDAEERMVTVRVTESSSNQDLSGFPLSHYSGSSPRLFSRNDLPELRFVPYDDPSANGDTIIAVPESFDKETFKLFLNEVGKKASLCYKVIHLNFQLGGGYREGVLSKIGDIRAIEMVTEDTDMFWRRTVCEFFTTPLLTNPGQDGRHWIDWYLKYDLRNKIPQSLQG
ncbi:hypothetical protein PMAYCL1PPCAC_23191, partial [Pristionchus mayeri]